MTPEEEVAQANRVAVLEGQAAKWTETLESLTTSVTALTAKIDSLPPNEQAMLLGRLDGLERALNEATVKLTATETELATLKAQAPKPPPNDPPNNQKPAQEPRMVRGRKLEIL